MENNPQQSAMIEIRRLMAEQRPNAMQQIYFAVIRHNEAFARIKQNIIDTSLNKAEFDERLKTLCEQYGYNFIYESSNIKRWT